MKFICNFQAVYILLLIVFSIAFLSCSRLPLNSALETRKIATGAGPEDMALDSAGGIVRLLVSCNERRTKEHFGEIYQVRLSDNATRIIPRIKTPDEISFNPHGIDVKTINGITRLYAVSHDDENNRHLIVVYRVYADSLVYEYFVENSAAMNSPNDLAVTEKGDFYVTNDAGKRGSLWEQFWKLKRSNVVYYNSELKLWKKVADHFVYANGIALNDTAVFVATTRSNKLFAFKRGAEGNLENRKVLSKISGQDNIMFYGDELIFTSHPKIFAFLKHVKSSEKKSPSQVHGYNLKTGEYRLLFSDDGFRISASSAALIYRNKLYVSQVFDPFILEVEVK